MSKAKCVKRVVREIIAFVIKFSCIPILIREVYARNKISIVLYHDPEPEVLDRHLKYFSKKYQMITLDRAIAAIQSKDWSNIPKKSLIITMDDGRKGNFKLLKIFKKYKIIPTIYICSRLVENDSVQYDHISRMDDEGFLKKQKGIEQCKQLLTHEEILAMNKYVDFQSHTQYHSILPLCQYKECENEIREAKKEIEIITGKDCKHFSYPCGYYTEREINMIKKEGYESARTIDVGWNAKNTDLYKLKILGISDDASLNWAVAQMTGIIMYIRYFFNGSLMGKYKQIKK